MGASGDSHRVTSLVSSSSSPILSDAPPPSPPLLPAKPKTSPPAGSLRQAILKLICARFAVVLRTMYHGTTTASDVVVVRAGEGIGGYGGDDVNVLKSRSSLEDLLKIEASASPNPETEREAADEPDMAPPKCSLEEEERALKVVVAFPDNGVVAGCRPASPGGGAALVRAPAARVKVKRLVVLVPAALRARSRATRIDTGRLSTKGRWYWMAAGGRGGRGDDKSELFYDRPIPLGRRCRVQHLDECPYV